MCLETLYHWRYLKHIPDILINKNIITILPVCSMNTHILRITKVSW